MAGVYFTNFENSAFTECASKKACKNWAAMESSWVDCEPSACRDLNERIKQLNGGPNVSATFAIMFVGKRTKERRAKRFLNDRESTVLIEQILDFQLIGRDG